MLKITVLDGHTVNPGDNSWAPIEQIGQLTVYDRTHKSEIVPRSQSAEILLTNKTELSAATLTQLPELRYIGVLATGYNVVDVAAARERGIPVCNIPEYGSRTVAQFTWSLILELCHHVGQHAVSVSNGDWTKCRDFCYRLTDQTELAGQTLGILGYGRIGRHVAEIGKAFGMHVVACKSVNSNRAVSDSVRLLSVDELFERSDVVSLHCPLTEDTRKIVNQRTLGLMKRSAYIVNTARGQLVDEADLAEALHSGRVAGAAVDVVSSEPIHPDNPLLTAPNCLITPHIAWSTLAARKRIVSMTAENISSFLDGRARNDVTMS